MQQTQGGGSWPQLLEMVVNHSVGARGLHSSHLQGGLPSQVPRAQVLSAVAVYAWWCPHVESAQPARM